MQLNKKILFTTVSYDIVEHLLETALVVDSDYCRILIPALELLVVGNNYCNCYCLFEKSFVSILKRNFFNTI